ncbi:MAG: aminotransferase-like domain-containing protein [Chloroflexota bacterium]
MNYRFADRMAKPHRSFVTEILRATEDPEIISFAGGLPNPRFFPVREVAQAADRVLSQDGQSILQYSTTQGYLPLREYIARRYRERKGLQVTADQILITNGSQQGFDLLGKVLLNEGDGIILERPAYHGAIQAFAMYQPTFHTVPLREDGIDLELLEEACRLPGMKMLYTVPNFQNPSGLTYSAAKRRGVAEIAERYGLMLVEDDPYGELRFRGEQLPTMRSYHGSAILLGTFSKTVAPGFRVGWVCADRELVEQLTMAKQATDFHSSYFDQRVLHQYLVDNDADRHIAVLTEAYRKQAEAMLSAMATHFPAGVRYTSPEGGMFIFPTLPEGLSALRLFDLAAREKVAFVPGQAFHPGGVGGDSCLRLSYSTSDEATIEEGIRRLGRVLSMELAEIA